jgi:hypothetical protein
MKKNQRKSLMGLTEKNEHNEDGRKASDAIEHELQIATDQFVFVMILHEHRRENKTNGDTQLKRVNKRKLPSESFSEFKK